MGFLCANSLLPAPFRSRLSDGMGQIDELTDNVNVVYSVFNVSKVPARVHLKYNSGFIWTHFSGHQQPHPDLSL